MRDKAIVSAHDFAHAPTVAYARTFAGCVFSVISRDWQSAREHGAVLLTFTEQHRLALWHAWANFYHSRALAEPAPTEAVLPRMYEALAEIQATGTRRHIPLHLVLLAEVHGRLGQATTGLNVIDEALAQVESTDERWWEAEIHRVKGELLMSLASENVIEAEACFQRAIAVSRSQRAKSLELRAGTSLARLWLKNGRRDEAAALLAPICGWFREKSASADTQDAKEVLDGIGA